MDTSRTGSYLSLKLTEIQRRFEELNDDDLAGLTLEEPEHQAASSDEGFNPYSRG
jgi:hypothetical protein